MPATARAVRGAQPTGGTSLQDVPKAESPLPAGKGTRLGEARLFWDPCSATWTRVRPAPPPPGAERAAQCAAQLAAADRSARLLPRLCDGGWPSPGGCLLAHCSRIARAV